MPRKIRLGVLGMGGRGIWFGTKEFLRDPRAEIVAFCDRNPAALRFAVEKTGLSGVRKYLDLRRMLADPDIEAVVNCTDDPDHAETSIAVLEAGKHLYLEKPMAQTIPDCDAIIAAWQRNPVVFMVGLELRYCTLCQEMRRIIDRGDIGDVRMGIVVDNVSVGGQYYFHGKDRREAYVKSLMLEKGTHSLDLANWFVGGHPRQVFCSAGLDVFGGDAPDDKRCADCEERDTCPYFISPRRYASDYAAQVREVTDLCVYAREVDVDDNSLILIDYDTGARVTYVECHFTPEYSREFTFIGTRGKMVAFYNNEQDFLITVTYRHSKNRSVYHPGRVEGGHGGGDPMIVRRFLDLVERGRPVAHGIEGARDSAAIAIAALESRKKNLPVAIPPVAPIEGAGRAGAPRGAAPE